MAEFKPLGPEKVPLHKGKAGRIVRPEEGKKFFEAHPALATKRGCYVFAMRSGGGITPMYVGKATKSFGQECFTNHKLGKCNEALAAYQRGNLVLFFYAAPDKKTSAHKINLLENYLIQASLSVNDQLLNIKKTKKDAWSIKGVLRSRGGKPSKSALDSKRMLNL